MKRAFSPFIKSLSFLIALVISLSSAYANAAAISVPAMQRAITVEPVEDLPRDFILGADISSLPALEAGGRVFYSFDGREQDLLKTLAEAGINTIRVRVWNDPFDEDGNGYGGGNCTIDTAVELGKRASVYGMGLLVDFHYSDFWADPGKQKAPKAWQNMPLDEKKQAVYDFTVRSLNKLRDNGVTVSMVQVGNETTTGLCGETDKRYEIMRTAAQAVRDTDSDIRIVTHFTNPEQQQHTRYAQELKDNNVDYDIFATSYYPAFHGTVDNLADQLEKVHQISGKQVMIAETSWDYDSEKIGAYAHSVQGQADEIADCARTMAKLGNYAVGMMYWEPAWIDVPGKSEAEKNAIRERVGAGWASSYSGSYDPDDAGIYYGATACIPSSLFDPEGYPLPSLRTFRYLREGSDRQRENLIGNPSFENGTTGWNISENNQWTVNGSDSADNARDGNGSLRFWNKDEVDFSAEQTVTVPREGDYTFLLSMQGGDIGENAELMIYAVSGDKRYEQRFTLDGWRSWKVPMLTFPCADTVTVGFSVKASAGAWGSVDCVQLYREPTNDDVFRLGDADGDNEIDVLDVTVILRHLVGIPIKRINLSAANVDGDDLDIIDATLLQRYLSNMKTTYPIGEYIDLSE